MIGTVSDLIVEALFLSDLQPSDVPQPGAVRAAVNRTVLRYRQDGIAAAVAAEFGDHADTAVARMCWARQVAASVYPGMCQSALAAA